MTTSHIIILLVTGAGVGFLGGLVGVGGAFIMGPVQDMVYLNMGIPPQIAVKMAFGTNLLVVLFTAISGAWRHHRNRAVWWKAAVTMGSCSLVGSFIGATIAAYLPGDALRITFGAIVILSAIQMLTSGLPQIDEKPRDNLWLWMTLALPIGIVTGLTGIGGGVLVVPVMTLILRFQMHKAVATSLAMMILTSTGGVIGYIVNGLGVPGLPAYSIGYVNLQSWFLLAVTSIGMVQVGAITAHRLPAKQLRYIFIALMFYMGLRMLYTAFKMLGLFSLPDLPI